MSKLPTDERLFFNRAVALCNILHAASWASTFREYHVIEVRFCQKQPAFALFFFFCNCSKAIYFSKKNFHTLKHSYHRKSNDLSHACTYIEHNPRYAHHTTTNGELRRPSDRSAWLI